MSAGDVVDIHAKSQPAKTQREVVVDCFLAAGGDGLTMDELETRLSSQGFKRVNSRVSELTRKHRILVRTNRTRLTRSGKPASIYIHLDFVTDEVTTETEANLAREQSLVDVLMGVCQGAFERSGDLNRFFSKQWSSTFRSLMAATVKELRYRAGRMDLWKSLMEAPPPSRDIVEKICERYGIACPSKGHGFPAGVLKRIKDRLVFATHPDRGGDRKKFEAIIADMDILVAYDESVRKKGGKA